MKNVTLCTCETTWHRIREYSLTLAGYNHKVFVLIKGRPEKKVRDLVFHKDNIINFFVPRILFRPMLFSFIFFLKLKNNTFQCIVDKRRTFAMVNRIFPHNLYFLEEHENSYSIYNVKGEYK